MEVMGGARKGGKVQFGNRQEMIIYEVGRHFRAKAAQRLGMGHITDFQRCGFGRVLTITIEDKTHLGHGE
jgi:hypothetical protein